MRRLLAAAVSAAALWSAAAPSFADQVNSVLEGGDPFVLVRGKTAWLYPTHGGDRLESWSSRDLAHWRSEGPLLRLADVKWAFDDGAPKHSLWAPDMLAAHGRYYLYYSIGPQVPTVSRIGVAVCGRPSGPCTDSGEPLLVGGNGFEAIDPMVFRDPRSRKTYLYAGGSAGSSLRVYMLAADLLKIDHEVKVDQPPNFTEGAFMHERRGVYYLSYSSGRWNDQSYSVHYATAQTPTGPWHYRGAILQSDGSYKGPGHHCFFRDPRDGSWKIAYHRWEGVTGPGPYRGKRRIAIQSIRYLEDGTIEPIRMGG
jgi:beta-xylosidase